MGVRIPCVTPLFRVYGRAGAKRRGVQRLDTNGKDVHLTRRTLVCAWAAMAGWRDGRCQWQVLAQPAQRTLVINIRWSPTA